MGTFSYTEEFNKITQNKYKIFCKNDIFRNHIFIKHLRYVEKEKIFLFTLSEFCNISQCYRNPLHLPKMQSSDKTIDIFSIEKCPKTSV